MSIPPLVCSTPPPPDQCDDDKDPEDFELSYSLSQEEDDDDAYNYGNISSFNFRTTTDSKPLETKQQEITHDIENHVQKQIFLNYELEKVTKENAGHVYGRGDINENKLNCEENMSIEDLNLKVDEEIENIVENNTEQNELTDPNISTIKEFDIPSNSNNGSPICDNMNVSSFDENEIVMPEALNEYNTDIMQQLEVNVSEEAKQTDKYDADNAEITVLEDNTSSSAYDLDRCVISERSVKMLEENTETERETTEQSTNLFVLNVKENVIDDDFGDFDDFQSVNTIASVVETSSNPWENSQTNESNFRNFTANFEQNSFQNINDSISVEAESVSKNPDSEIKQLDDNFEDDDDFGDFDDFKSSSAKPESNDNTTDNNSQCHEFPVLNLQSNESEHQIMESITKVLSTVFLEEISETETGFEGKLESLLSETWGHLMETDERQPYIVNWNNSLGQKTLLKALCIDSRNILFGPKWSSNMPKFAANLSNAPLQPQKQVSVSSSIVPQSETVAEKSTCKPATSWSDPFTSEGQESCNTENQSATTPGPPDLDVFEATVSTKSDKIYSNTMSIQPLRQINLPDTHIFTPTDSEIPRSTTIHYDRSPPVLLPQSAVTDISQSDSLKPPTSNNANESNIDENEYWEFQNFKSNLDPNCLPANNSKRATTEGNNLERAITVNALPKPNVAYQTDLLQPIKVEPAMPALNWPDPGEVKGVLDDFTDFVSMSSQSEKPDSDSSTQPIVFPESGNTLSLKTSDNMSSSSTEPSTEITKPESDFGFDDDFDTFQSAFPTKRGSDNIKNSCLENSSQILSSQITEFDNGSPKLGSIKSDTISFASILKPNEALTQNIGYIPKSTERTSKSLSPSGTQMQPNLLQPTPASFGVLNTQSQQKSGQILQPLSLESYSQINWPSPGIDLQDLSRFNPVETLHSLKSDLSVSGVSKGASPVHVAKNSVVNQVPDDDVWGDFVSSKPKQQTQPKKPSVFVDDDEWTDFISSPSVKPQNGLNTISLNVHTNSNIQKSGQNKFAKKSNQPPLDIPTLNYITPKSNPHKSYNDKHFQNL